MCFSVDLMQSNFGEVRNNSTGVGAEMSRQSAAAAMTKSVPRRTET